MTAACYRRPPILAQIPRDRHAVIEANAGTGKTYAIQYLVLDLLLNTSCTVEELLVVTFTERAAEELRSRLRALFESVLSGAAVALEDHGSDLVMLDEAATHKLETALFSFDRAPICTIHAFCRRVLSDLAFDTGAPFGLEVVDAQRAFHRAFRAALREVIATEKSSRALLDEWMADGETAGHPNLVDSLEDLLRQAHFNRYSESEARERNQRSLDELAEVFDANLLKRLCARKNKKTSPDSLASADELASIVRRCNSRDALLAALGAFDFDVLHYRTNAYGNLQEARLIHALEAVRAACSLEGRVVASFLPLVERRLLEDKRQNSEIEYGDMLEWVWDALNSARGEALASRLRERYRFGLIDEFQDTDDLQWKIFRKMFLESDGNIVYVVGDPKQAIYSFRGADVFTYLGARREILESGGALVKLIDNYRSTKDVISALNRILNDNVAAPLLCGDIRYDSPVECGRPDLRARDINGKPLVPVTLLRYCPGSSPGSAPRMRATLGRYIAETIRKILFDPDQTIAISDKEGSQRVDAGDIYILTRTGAEAVEIGGYLREQGVPFAFYKKEGLFQTSEAYDVLDVLRAIEEPDSQSKRLKAWISPFFAVPYPDLFDCGEITAGHPLLEQLYEWKALVDQGRLGVLFDQLLHGSGLAGRECFLSNSGRELTNYLHIIEILLERAWKENLSLKEIISQLESFIAGSALPAGIDSNIQRVESDRSAVQIMSVHMSKGLQADVVFLFGGTAQPTMQPRIAVYHDERGDRRIAVGKAGRAAASELLEREAREERQRLVYVGITRAAAKVYLPIYPDGSTKRPLNGYYEALNDRLKVLSRELDRNEASLELIEQVDISPSTYDAEGVAKQLQNRIATWSPPDSLMTILHSRPSERLFEELRARSRAMQTRSYTSLGGGMTHRLAVSDDETEEFKYDLDRSETDTDLKGGRRVGIFLHEAIEKLDLAWFDGMPDASSWRAREEIIDLYNDLMRRHQVNDARWFERGTEVVFNALTSRIVISAGTTVGPLYRCPSVREMEFVYPVPERSHALLQSTGDGQWTVERGYLKGFVDFVFNDSGLYYFADWKSDFLPSYERGAIETHVNEHYALQAKIYSVGIVRLLGIRSKEEYEKRFGGLLYLFLRGMKRAGDGTEGVYFQRPAWEEICLSERSLIDSIPEHGTSA